LGADLGGGGGGDDFIETDIGKYLNIFRSDILGP